MKTQPPRLAIICLEDEPPVLDAIVRDLADFEQLFRIEPVENTTDARAALQALDAAGIPLALALCDHLLPGETGTDFLVSLNREESTRRARKVLITAQAGLKDTVRAVNDGDLNHFIAKPWTPGELRSVVRTQLTDYVIDSGMDPLPYVSLLDGVRLLASMQAHNQTTDA